MAYNFDLIREAQEVETPWRSSLSIGCVSLSHVRLEALPRFPIPDQSYDSPASVGRFFFSLLPRYRGPSRCANDTHYEPPSRLRDRGLPTKGTALRAVATT